MLFHDIDERVDAPRPAVRAVLDHLRGDLEDAGADIEEVGPEGGFRFRSWNLLFRSGAFAGVSAGRIDPAEGASGVRVRLTLSAARATSLGYLLLFAGLALWYDAPWLAPLIALFPAAIFYFVSRVTTERRVTARLEALVAEHAPPDSGPALAPGSEILN